MVKLTKMYLIGSFLWAIKVWDLNNRTIFDSITNLLYSILKLLPFLLSDCFLLSLSSVGKAFSNGSVRSRETHVLWGRGPVHVSRWKTVRQLVLRDSREFPHLHTSVSSREKLWVINSSLSLANWRFSFCVKRNMYKKMCIFYAPVFSPCDKGVWLKARTVAPDSSHTKTMLWDSLWMPSCSKEWQARWAK